MRAAKDIINAGRAAALERRRDGIELTAAWDDKRARQTWNRCSDVFN